MTMFDSEKEPETDPDFFPPQNKELILTSSDCGRLLTMLHYATHQINKSVPLFLQGSTNRNHGC